VNNHTEAAWVTGGWAGVAASLRLAGMFGLKNKELDALEAGLASRQLSLCYTWRPSLQGAFMRKLLLFLRIITLPVFWVNREEATGNWFWCVEG
jgi:hypothetical protein